MKKEIKGVVTALVTPFLNGEVDYASLRKLVRAQLDQGIDGFVVNGTTGESPCLNFAEVEKIFEVVKHEVGGQVPLIIGTGSNSTRKTIEFTRAANQWGPDAVLVVVPYYNRPPQRGMIVHFGEVARASSAPVILYNVPSRTVANLEPATVHELAREPNVAGLKDATGDMTVLERVREGVDADFTLLSGDDGTCVEFAARGGSGVIAVASHVIGREMRQALAAARGGDAEAGPAYSAKFAPLLKALYLEPNPIAVKTALHFMGVIASPELRAPLVALDERHHEELRRCLRNLGKM
jgi:4-hydroxy-tetrahydrodipicolinate synthase